VSQLQQQIQRQPEEFQRLLTSGATRQQVHTAAEGLHRVHRIWVVGTGSSQHAASLGAAMLQDAGRSAHAVSSMQFVRNAPIVGPNDGVVIVTHSGSSAYALAARSLAFGAGIQTFTICRRGLPFNDVVETVDEETSQTHSIGYTSALLVLAMIAAEMGADSLTADALAAVPEAAAIAIAGSGTEAVPASARALVLIGAGPSAITAAEGALKAREAARMVTAGFDAEYFLHGSGPALTAQDHLVALVTPDDDGLVEAVARTAEGEGVGVTRVREPAPLPASLAQIPLAIRLQVLASRLAGERGTDPDVVLTGGWADPALWAVGSP
jgi:glucosamine--fructose-6-phosphate aminotransferase (isomerizing)